MPRPSSVSRVSRLFSRLLKHFGPQKWWPAQSAWEMMVGAILTQNTAWTNVEKALKALKQNRALSIRSIATMPRPRLARLIRSSGYFRQKAVRLQLFAREMQKNPDFFGQLCGSHSRHSRRSLAGNPSCRKTMMDPPPVSAGDDVQEERLSRCISSLRQRLLSLHGVGPETADSILLYAGGYPVFVVDAYTRRIGRRIGLFKTDDYHDIQAFFQSRCAPSTYNEFHALLVALGKNLCTSRHPKCGVCPVSGLCERRGV